MLKLEKKNNYKLSIEWSGKSVVGDDLRSTTFAVSAYSLSAMVHDSETCGTVERSSRTKQ